MSDTKRILVSDEHPDGLEVKTAVNPETGSEFSYVELATKKATESTTIRWAVYGAVGVVISFLATKFDLGTDQDINNLKEVLATIAFVIIQGISLVKVIRGRKKVGDIK